MEKVIIIALLTLIIIAAGFLTLIWYANIRGWIHEIAPDVRIMAILFLCFLVLLISDVVLRLIEAWQRLRRRMFK